jgi:hypothetical protein
MFCDHLPANHKKFYAAVSIPAAAARLDSDVGTTCSSGWLIIETLDYTLAVQRPATAGRSDINTSIMKYMLLVYMDEQAMTDKERQRCYVESAQLTQDLNAKGQYVAAGPLHSVATATSVRVRDGRRVVTDGPFAETREQLGGYYVVEADDLDEAMAIAERIPPARYGTIEIRPMMEIEGLPNQKPAREQGLI